MESQVSSNDIFRILLGNLPGKSQAIVTLKFIQPVKTESDGSITIVLPTVIVPRYVPIDTMNDEEALKEIFSNPTLPISISNSLYKVQFSANVCLGSNAKIRDVSSLTSKDELSFEYNNDKTHVHVALTNGFEMDHDFGISIIPEELYKPLVVAEEGYPLSTTQMNWMNYDIAMACVEPNSSEKKEGDSGGVYGDEYWFLVDQSGSMSGRKMSSAKSAMLLFVKSLPVGCFFNVVSFGSAYSTMFIDG